MESSLKRTRRGGAYGGPFAFATSRGYASNVPASILVARPRRRYARRTAVLRVGRRRMSAVKRQSIRTGGWANPARMGERKFKDVNNSPSLALAATFTTPVLLNGIVPGSDAGNRIGRKVIWKTIYLRMVASLAPTSVGGAPVRVIIFYDKQANATAAAVTDLLVTDNFVSPNNLNNRDRFVVITDQVMDPISTGDQFSVSMECFKKINLETVFNSGSAGTVGDITSGAIYIMFAQSGAVTTAAPGVTYYARLRFDDP